MSLVDALPTEPSADALYDAFTALGRGAGTDALSAPGGGGDRAVQRQQRRPRDADRLGEVDGRVAAHFAALAEGRTTFYTAPIKALVSEKFFALCAIFGAENVGMLTGDASVNADAPIICCTAEVLANIALREGAGADVGQVVMDEFHFYADGQRGWAWQVPLLCLPQAQFLLMSATLGDVSDDHRRPDAAHRPRDGARSTTPQRPVPLTYAWSVEPLHELLEELVAADQAPIYVVHFTQASAHGAGAVAAVGQALHARGARRDRRGDRRLPLHRRVRPHAVQARAQRHRRPSRRHAAALPPAGRAARPDRRC